MISVLLLAAGRGERAGFPENKILKELNGLPVISYSLSAFAPFADEIIIACREEDEPRLLPLLAPYPQARLCRGGATRAESVLCALETAKGDMVLVHDAARPFVTEKAIRACIESVEKYGSGICAIPASDTVAIVDGGEVVSCPKRDSVYLIQTPQGFSRTKLLAAYHEAKIQNRLGEFTDDGSLYAAFVSPPHIATGERGNKKVTFAEDFLPERVGFGVDTHAFYGDGEGAPFINFITLGGVRIPSQKILKAHSDGDVLVHALMDALLTAAGLRDIGYYFPDTDKRFAGADSMELLKKVLTLVKEAGFAPQNVSISILAQTPRLSPYIEEMRKELAHALNLSLSAVGIAAGTNEKLGYVGEEKGITVYATVLLKKYTSEE